ncbi:hypothetical protein TNCV_267211 [Trichonephila clavipes]|nr:hypothetical protein TNCV_267211 [Trichonephila clavipes]
MSYRYSTGFKSGKNAGQPIRLNALANDVRTNDVPIDLARHSSTLNMQDNSGAQNTPPKKMSNPAPPKRCRSMMFSWVPGARHMKVRSTSTYRPTYPKHLYTVYLETVIPEAEESWQDRCDAVLCLFLLAVTAKYRSLFGVVTQIQPVYVVMHVTSTHITIILEWLPKPGEDTLGDSKFPGYFQVGMPTFQTADNYNA